jgi:hypothetical protein
MEPKNNPLAVRTALSPEEPALSLSKGTAESQTCPNERWEPPHLCGGTSALALGEGVSTLIARFSAGNTEASLVFA